ncbi:hypothetical protein EMA8858_03877 [Emticicia aquatica]|uniref:Uncharacterized protein n=1 Tax=Emticicia aquatica TaxID=1681835 RepID=A0ABN8F3C7_9BACT|nr:hypothetical protein [Emticicia aquatica]CAH0997743.1 hypothetical protein EMA8858_03877 [Emticicia aquatica]
MKKKRTINSIIGTILIFGFSILIASFGSSGVIKPSAKVKKVLASITTTDTVSVQKKTKRVEQEANITDQLLENSDDYKTSYWIGSIPELLKDSIHTAGLVFIDSTAFSKVVPANIQEVYINADGVPSIARFVDSPFFKSMIQNNISAIVYNNKANDKDEQLVLGLGGMYTFNADFMMIVYKESGLSVIPVGNDSMQYKPKRLSVFQASNFEVTPINDEKNPNARIAAKWCYDYPYLYNLKQFAYNRLPKKIESVMVVGSNKRKYHFLDGNTASILCEKTDPLTTYKLKKRVTIERGQNKAQVTGGTGQVTQRENDAFCKGTTVNKVWDWKVSVTLGYKAELELAKGISASWTKKVKGTYGQSESEGTTDNECISVGQTFYSNACSYACCDSELSIDILQDTYEVRTVYVGSIWINYYNIASSSNDAKAGKWTRTYPFPITLRFKYFPSSPLYYTWQETGERFASLQVRNIQWNCNPKKCYSYTSGECNAKNVK